MKLFTLALLTVVSTPAFAAELLYPVGTYRGQCDSSFLEHIYKNDEKVGIRNARQFLDVELEVTDDFGTQTLHFKDKFTINGKPHEHEITNQVNQTGLGTWRETGGSGDHVWTTEWRQHDDGTIRNEKTSDGNYTSERWILVAKDRIYSYEYSEIKPGTPRKFRDGHQNISTRMICTFDKQ